MIAAPSGSRRRCRESMRGRPLRTRQPSAKLRGGSGHGAAFSLPELLLGYRMCTAQWWISTVGPGSDGLRAARGSDAGWLVVCLGTAGPLPKGNRVVDREIPLIGSDRRGAERY